MLLRFRVMESRWCGAVTESVTINGRCVWREDPSLTIQFHKLEPPIFRKWVGLLSLSLSLLFSHPIVKKVTIKGEKQLKINEFNWMKKPNRTKLNKTEWVNDGGKQRWKINPRTFLVCKLHGIPVWSLFTTYLVEVVANLNYQPPVWLLVLVLLLHRPWVWLKPVPVYTVREER